MRKKFLFTITVVFIFGVQNLVGQVSFPNSWQGNYKGELEIFGVESVRMRVLMKLAIAKKKDTVYQWKISYEFKGKEDIRDYELKIVDVLKGHYLIDEKNSIIIDSYYKNDIFTSFFEVMNSYIISSYTKENEDIVFEIISGDGNKTTSSGNKNVEGEEIPEVISYLVNGRQKAVLKKYQLSAD